MSDLADMVELLRQAMHEAGVTQRAMAEHLEISIWSMNRYLKGAQRMPNELIEEAAAALGLRWSVRLVRA